MPKKKKTTKKRGRPRKKKEEGTVNGSVLYPNSKEKANAPTMQVFLDEQSNLINKSEEALNIAKEAKELATYSLRTVDTLKQNSQSKEFQALTDTVNNVEEHFEKINQVIEELAIEQGKSAKKLKTLESDRLTQWIVTLSIMLVIIISVLTSWWS